MQTNTETVLGASVYDQYPIVETMQILTSPTLQDPRHREQEVTTKAERIRTTPTLESDIDKQRQVTHELQKILSQQLIEQSQKETLILTMFELQLKSMVQILLQLIQGSDELSHKIKTHNDKKPTQHFDIFMNSISKGLSESISHAEFKNDKDTEDEWVWIQSNNEELTEQIQKFISVMEKKLCMENFAIQPEEAAQNNAHAPILTSVAHYSKIFAKGTAQGAFYCLKVTYYTYVEIVRLATLAGVGVLIVQSPWIGPLTLLLKLIT